MDRSAVVRSKKRPAVQDGLLQYTPGKLGGPGVRRRQKKGTARAWRRVSLWLLCVAALAAVPVLVCTCPALAVRQVRVSGLSGLTPAEAQSTLTAAVVPAHTNWVRAPVAGLERRLARLPWVESASVSRRLPPRLEVRVTPRTTAAVLVTPSARWELDGQGVAIRPARQGVRGGVEIASEADLQVTDGRVVPDAAVVACLAALQPRKAGKPLPVGKIAVDRSGELCLNMIDTVAIRLGQVDDLSAKLALVGRIYEEEPGIASKVQCIDLRFPDAPACIPREATTPSPREAANPSSPGRTTALLRASGEPSRVRDGGGRSRL